MADDIYGAADPDLENAVAWFDERVDAYYDHVSDLGILDLWRATDRAVFAGFYTGGEIGKLGKQGELRSISINDIGNLHHHMLTMLTGQRPNFEARAGSPDASAQQQAPIGVAVIETAMREKHLEARSKDVADIMLRAGEGWGLKRWNPLAGPTFSSEPEVDEEGQPVVDEQGQPVMKAVPAGDVEYEALHPLDVIRDTYRPGSDPRWRIVRRWANRWDLVAQHPDLKDKILALPVRSDEQGRRVQLRDTNRLGHHVDSDDVAVYDAYVERCPAVPDGRLLTFLSTECVLFDGALPYRKSPLYRAAAKELPGTCFGYSLFWDVLAPQMALNNLHSSLISIASVAGVPAVWQPDGNGLRRYLVGALQVLQGGTIKPEVLDFLAKSPVGELVKLAELYGGAMERLSGINATFRGQAGEGQKGLSGAAYALFAARAIEFASSFQGAHATFLESIATATIHDYQDMGAGEYLITLAGEGNSYRVASFKADDVNKLASVSLKLTNPMQATTAGRMEMFNAMKEVPGAIADPRSAVTLLETGRLEPATQAAERERENIAKENEALGRGEPVRAIRTDRFWLHIPEHMGVLSSPEARANPDAPAVLVTLTHVAEHEAQAATLTPAMLAVMGCPPEIVQAMAMSVMAPPVPGVPSGTGAPMPGATDGTMPEAMPDAGAVTADAMGMEQPGMPSMPMDPLSGERMAPPQGA